MGDDHELKHQPETHFTLVDGHLVDTRIHSVDRFYDGRTGERVTDAQWDAEQALITEHEAADRVERRA